MISDGAAEAIKEDDAMSVFFMDFDMAPSVIWARDLYDQMQIRSDFRKWFPRMCQYGFVEGRDYEFVPRVRPQDEGGRTVQRYVKDYRITLEMAKQLYKLHHFHKNDCFRSCEGQHCMGTDHWMQAVIELLHQHKCKSHAPPKRFYESQPPDSLVTTTQIAKEYGCGAKVFNRLLHLHGIQYRANNQWVLYAKHQDKGYTANLVFRLHRSDGSAVEKLHTAWTHKGRKFLYHALMQASPLADYYKIAPIEDVPVCLRKSFTNILLVKKQEQTRLSTGDTLFTVEGWKSNPKSRLYEMEKTAEALNEDMVYHISIYGSDTYKTAQQALQKPIAILREKALGRSGQITLADNKNRPRDVSAEETLRIYEEFLSDVAKSPFFFANILGQFTRNYTQTTKRGLLTTNKG